jgi:hypothetical protein
MTEKAFFKKYVQPFLWEGWCWVDGGWGNKNKVLEVTQEAREFKIAFYFMPTYDTTISKFEGTESETDINHRYHVAFPGYNWPKLKNTIRELIEAGQTEQDWIVNSFVSTESPDVAEDIYRLAVKVRNGRVSYSIVKGEFVPSFVRNEVVARW